MLVGDDGSVLLLEVWYAVLEGAKSRKLLFNEQSKVWMFERFIPESWTVNAHETG